MNKVKFFYAPNLPKIEKSISDFVDKTKAYITHSYFIQCADGSFACQIVYRIS